MDENSTPSGKASPSTREKPAERAVAVNFITAAWIDDSGMLRVRTRGSRIGSSMKPLPGTAGRQILERMLKQTVVHGGTWTSLATLRSEHGRARAFLEHLWSDHRIDDLLDPTLSPSMAWEAMRSRRGTWEGNGCFRKLLAGLLADLREDGHAHELFLMSRSFEFIPPREPAYPPGTGEAIEKVARGRVFEWYLRYRQALTDRLGHVPKNYLWLTADDVHPGDVCPTDLLVQEEDLSAAAVLLSLVDDKGPNLSVIQSLTDQSAERWSRDSAFVTGAKNRNKQLARTPADAGSLFSYGGLVQFVTAATSVERATRAGGADFDRLLFVPTGHNRPIDGVAVHRWWQTTTDQWPDEEVSRPPRLNFRKLRKTATMRGKPRGRTVVGQTSRTRKQYLADVFPDAVLVPMLLDTQNSISRIWRAEMTVNDEAAKRAASELRQSRVMHVGVAACATGGQSLDDPTKPCGLGPVSCFTCPAGHRVPELIPGLIGAVQFTDHLRDHSPQEWLQGEAPTLNVLAKRTLEQFPAAVVAGASTEDIATGRALVACVYWEARTNA